MPIATPRLPSDAYSQIRSSAHYRSSPFRPARRTRVAPPNTISKNCEEDEKGGLVVTMAIVMPRPTNNISYESGSVRLYSDVTDQGGAPDITMEYALGVVGVPWRREWHTLASSNGKIMSEG